MTARARAAVAAVLTAAVVLVRGADASADPAPPRITVRPSALRLGQDSAAEIEIDAPDVAEGELEVLSSVGTISRLVRARSGRYSARFEPPATRAPDVAVVLARARGAAVAAVASVSLAGRYHLSLALEAGARVEVRAGEGTVRRGVAPASGALDFQLHVPPGVDLARIVAVDAVGNRSETTQALDLPPAHRALFAPIAPPADGAREFRWLLAFALPDGSLAGPRAAPALEASGSAVRIRPLAPGLFEIALQPPRQLSPATLTLALREPGVAPTPPTLRFDVPGSVPATAVLAPGVRVRAGAPLQVPLVLRTADGEPVLGLAGLIQARIGSNSATEIVARGDGYLVQARAPESSGRAELRARVAVDGGRAVETSSSIEVLPGPASRLVAVRAPALTLGLEDSVSFRGLDRYGNAAAIGHPVVHLEGGTLVAVEPEAGGVRVRLVPTARRVRVSIRGDYELADGADFVATRPPVSFWTVGMTATVRWNLGALMLVGGRARALGLALPRRWLALGADVEVGLEYGRAADAQGRSAELFIVPAFVHAVALVRAGPFWIGPAAGAGLRYVYTRVALGADAGGNGAQWVPGWSGALSGRLSTGAGVFSLQVGYEAGRLDAALARGSIGGIFGSLGWGTGL